MQQQHHELQAHQQQQTGGLVDSEQEPLALMAESERMRQELEELQKKISKLNVNRDVGSTEVGIGGGATNNAPNVPSRRCICSHGYSSWLRDNVTFFSDYVNKVVISWIVSSLHT